MTIKSFEALASGETLEIRVYGAIGQSLFFGGCTAEQVADSIKQNPGCKSIVMKINSPGGDAFEGMAIRSILSQQNCETVAEIEGLAASAASIAAMGCKTIRMHVGSAMMIHEASGNPNGPMDVKELKKLQSALETLNAGMASIYAKRTGMTEKQCRALMSDETWMTAEQAVKDGFADEVVADDDGDEAVKVAASFDFKLFGYRKVPAYFRAEGGAGEENEPILPPAPEKKSDDEGDDQGDDADGGDTQPDVQPVTKEDLREAMESLAARQQVLPLSAAITAEASSARKRLDTMTIKLIAQAMGMSAETDEPAVIATAQQLAAFAGEVKSVAKAQTLEAVIGVIRGLQAAAEQVPVLTAQLTEQTKKLEDQERAAILAADKADPEGRRLTPALETLVAAWPLDMLKAFLATAPHVVQVQASKGAQQQPANNAAVGGGVPQPVLFNGKAWEQMAPGEKAELYAADRATYDALKANHVERGEPRAQSQQQRASA